MKDQVRTPLRTVLRNFLNHIEKLESSTCPEKSYDAEFQDLKLFSESVKSLKEYACTEGEKETNKKKNRYKDILPFDVSRVILNEYAGIPGSDYINANFIKGASGSPAYIASQGPLPCTVIDFWRMVVQCEVQVIVMACNEEEAGKAKCEKYWVDEGEEKQFGLISVKLLKASTVCPDFSVRTMRLKYTNVQNEMEERTVCQLHYVAWPDHGVPSVVQPLLDMVRLVRDTQASETLPVLVHCSAGCGRTGTICAIDYVWGLLRTGRLTDDFSLLSLIREMRKQRIAMVQTKEQYVLVHQAVRELFKEQLLMIDSHPYENVDPDGLLLIMKEEENHYDTVGNLTKMNLDEKKDNTMEKDVAPPLPQKKQPMYPSKQEKDVENLSAQQRSIMHSSKQKQPLINTVGKSPGLLRTSEVPLQRERPLVQKKISNPIPSKGILRVPHLKNLSSASVKRSKSLKLTNMTAQQKVVVSADIPIEIRRRGSLESNIDEVGSLVGESSYNDSQYEDVTVAKSIGNPSPVYETPRAVQKYDVLKYLQEKRMLVRSLTTFDMRQTTTPQRLPLDAKSAGNNPVKYRLSRSNTQVDFSRLVRNRVADGGVVASNQPSARSVSRNFTSGESQGSLSVFTSTRDGNMSQGLEPENVSGLSKNCPETVNRGDCSTLLHQLRSDYSGRPTDRESFRDYKDGHNFHAEQVTPHRNRVSTHAVNLYDTTRQVSGRYQEAPFPNHDPPSTSRLVHGQKPKPNFMNRHPVYDTYSNAQQIGGRYPKHPSFINGPTGVGSSVYDSRNRHQNDLDKRNGHLPNKEIQGRIQSQLHRKDPLPSPSLVQYQVTDPGPHTSHSETSSSPRKPFEMGNSKVLKKRGNYPTWENEQRRGISCTSPQTLGNKPSNPSADHLFPHSIVGNVWKPSYRLSKQNVDQLLGSPSEEHFRVPTEPIQKNFGHSSPNVDSTTTLELDHHSDYFSNAPGVDLDQVAASITQKDASKTNLMKVALEAFNIKRSRQQARLPDSSPSTSSSSKGSSPSSTMVNPKKKQQHYL